MLGIVIRDLPYLKVLQPICIKLGQNKKDYMIFLMDCYKGEKEYNRPTVDRVNKSSPNILKCAKKVIAFNSDKDLINKLKANNIDKMLSVEIGQWAKNFFGQYKSNNIKLYSMVYLTDSVLQDHTQHITAMDRVYYPSDYLMGKQMDFMNIYYLKSRDRSLGSPVFDCLKDIKNENATDTLILLPNVREGDVGLVFGSKANFISMIESFGKNLIFKTRKKQWLPKEIERQAKNIIYDGDLMYPSPVSSIFNNTGAVVMFYSSGIYEAIIGKQYVINIPLPLKMWRWNKDNMKRYFESEVYGFNGVVKTVSQKDAIMGKFDIRKIDLGARDEWIKKCMGNLNFNSADLIAEDILK